MLNKPILSCLIYLDEIRIEEKPKRYLCARRNYTTEELKYQMHGSTKESALTTINV